MKRICPNCKATLRIRFVDCEYYRNINGKLVPAENTASKEALFVCPKCVYAEGE